MHSALQQIIDFLSEFTEVSEEEIATMTAFMHISSFEKNTVLHQHGTVSERAGFILEGAARTYYVDDKGVDHTTAFLFENQPLVFIESFIQQTPVMLNTITL